MSKCCGEIVVSAQRREQNMQKAGIAVSAISGRYCSASAEAIEVYGFTTLDLRSISQEIFPTFSNRRSLCMDDSYIGMSAIDHRMLDAEDEVLTVTTA